MSDEYSIHGRFLAGKVGEDWYRFKLEQMREREERFEEEIGVSAFVSHPVSHFDQACSVSPLRVVKKEAEK